VNHTLLEPEREVVMQSIARRAGGLSLFILTPKGTAIRVKLKNDTVWLDAHAIAELFGVTRPAIVKHIGNIYKTVVIPIQNSRCNN